MPSLRLQRWRIAGVITLLACVCALPASAGLHEEIAAAEELLAQGEAVQALEIFQRLQVDHPESPEVILGVGTAQYRAGEVAVAGGAAEEARERFSEAQETFQRLFGDSREDVRASAMFDYANAIAKSAKTYDPQQEAQRQERALESAVAAYEQVVDAFPDHTAARQNLDHVRYVLKMLQQREEGQEQPPATIRLRATTELPQKEAVVKEHEVILQDPQAPDSEDAPADPSPSQAPAAQPAAATEAI